MVENQDDDEIGEVGEQMMRMSVNTARVGKEAWGLTKRTYMLARDHPVVLAMKSSLQEYSAAVKGNKKNDKGPSHFHVGASAVQAIVSLPVPEDTDVMIKNMMICLK